MVIDKYHFKFWVDEIGNPNFMIPIEKRYHEIENKELDHLLFPAWDIFWGSFSDFKDFTEARKKLFKIRAYIPKLVFKILKQGLEILHYVNQIQDYLNPNSDLNTRYFHLRDILTLNIQPTMFKTSFAKYLEVWNYQMELNLSTQTLSLKTPDIDFDNISFEDFWEDVKSYNLNVFEYIPQQKYKELNLQTFSDWLDQITEVFVEKFNKLFLNVFEYPFDEELKNSYHVKISACYDESGEAPDTIYTQTCNDEASYFNLFGYYVIK